MLEEGDERSSDRGDLRRSHIHQLYFSRSDDREVSFLTCLDGITKEVTFIIQRSIPLSYDEVFFFLCGIVLQSFFGEVNLPVLYAAIRRGDEAEVIDLRIDTERRDQTDVWSFRCLNRTETTVVGIVYVTHLEAGTLTGETARAKGRETTLVGDFGQRVRLVHELRQRIRTEEGVDDRRKGLSVDQIRRHEDFVVTDVHTLTYGTCHTSQTYTKLIIELLTDRTYTAVGEVVNIVDDFLRVDQPDEVLDDGYDILVGQHTHLGIDVEAELLINTVATYFTEVVALVGEEEVRENFASVGFIGRVCITQLTIDIIECVVLGVTRVLLEGVEDQGEVQRVLGLLLVQKDGLVARLEDEIDIVFRDLCLTLYEDGDTLHGDDFTRILIAEVINISLGHTTSQAATDVLLEVSTRDLHLFRQVEEIKDLLIRFKANST